MQKKLNKLFGAGGPYIVFALCLVAAGILGYGEKNNLGLIGMHGCFTANKAASKCDVMLAIGTNPEYFNAVWVKNEWSRFLKIIQKDRSKLLIPCYRDMDAYELPEEFAHLQAQDMSKIGFINDIVRGIKKVVVKNEPAKAVEAPKAQNNSFDALIKRIYLLLEDGDFNKADELCEQVLNGEPENAEAYICELLIEFKCHTKDELSSIKQSIVSSKNYNKVLRFGNDAQIAYVKGAEESVQAYFKKMREEEERKKEEAAKSESSAGLEFALNEDGKGYTLTKVGSCKEKNIVIDMHKGLPVTNIGDYAFLKCSNLTSITIPNSVTSIGDRAFSGCYNLTSITIPNSVTSIGPMVFFSCSNLKSITIPNSVTSIGMGAFFSCSNLKSITIPNSVTSIGYGALEKCYNLTSIYCFDNWDNIEGIKNADIPEKAKIFHYSEKKPSLRLFKRYWHYVNGVPTEW